MGPYLYWKTAPQGPNRESDKKLGDRKDSNYMHFDVLLFKCHQILKTTVRAIFKSSWFYVIFFVKLPAGPLPPLRLHE